MSEYIALGQVATPLSTYITGLQSFSPVYTAVPIAKALQNSQQLNVVSAALTCDPPCRSGSICDQGRCVRPAKRPPPPARTPEDLGPEEEFDEEFEDDLYDNGAAGSYLLYGGIAAALLLAAAGGYYYWVHVRSAQEEEEE
jgi:hypothetical protein